MLGRGFLVGELRLRRGLQRRLGGLLVGQQLVDVGQGGDDAVIRGDRHGHGEARHRRGQGQLRGGKKARQQHRHLQGGNAGEQHAAAGAEHALAPQIDDAHRRQKQGQQKAPQRTIAAAASLRRVHVGGVGRAVGIGVAFLHGSQASFRWALSCSRAVAS